MLTVARAHRLIATHLGDSPRARHSAFVGHVMGRLAALLQTDVALWEATGLVHDLDFEATAGDRSQHGLLAATWLANELPEDALTAIRAHDHRTGVISEAPIARGLKLADALAIACDTLGSEARDTLAATDIATRLARPFRRPALSAGPAAQQRPASRHRAGRIGRDRRLGPSIVIVAPAALAPAPEVDVYVNPP